MTAPTAPATVPALGKAALRRLRTRSELVGEARRLTAEHGLAGFTIEQLCEAVGISRRTFFNHFASKDALATGLLARLRDRSATDAEAIRAAADGATDYYLTTSAPGGAIPGGLTRTYLAALRAADHARDGTAVRDALAAVDADALDALSDRLGDPALAWLVQLIGDGLYLRTLIGTPLPEGLSVDDVLALLRPHLPPGESGF